MVIKYPISGIGIVASLILFYNNLLIREVKRGS